jgi:hypothetical protein
MTRKSPARHEAAPRKPPRKSRAPRKKRHPALPADPAAHADLPFPPPQTPDELHDWLATTLDIHIARTALVDGHTAPFDYLGHAFFEGRGRWLDGNPAHLTPSRAEHPSTPIDSVVWANRGGGKTFLGAVATMLDLVFKPGIEVRILAGSLEQASRMHTHLRTIFAHDSLADLVKGRITDTRLRLINGSGVELLAQSQASVRGTRIQKLRCDEVELFDPMVWEAAQLTTRSRRCGRLWVRGAVECLSTMHVPHGIMARLVKDTPRHRALFKWGLIDTLTRCPDDHRCSGIGLQPDAEVREDSATPQTPSAPESSLLHIPLPILTDAPDCSLLTECQGRAKTLASGHITIEDALTQKSRVSSPTWGSEMLCLRPRRSDSVIPEFNAAIHVVKQLPWDAPTEDGPLAPVCWVGGMDFGYRAPTVILWAAIDVNGNVFIADERSAAGLLLEEHIAAINSGLGRPWPALAWIGIDPAGSSGNSQTGLSDADLLRAAGLVVRCRPMNVEPGLSLVRARFKPADGPPRLFIHERCRTLIESLEKYHYPADRPESLTPVKDGHDHAVDALRYLMVNLDRPYQTARGQYVG